MDLAEKLRSELDVVDWEPLWPHYARGVVVAVSPALDLVEVGVAFGQDRSEAVAGWLSDALLVRPDDAQAAAWSEEKRRFEVIIVPPWVLVRPLGRPPGISSGLEHSGDDA